MPWLQATITCFPFPAGSQRPKGTIRLEDSDEEDGPARRDAGVGPLSAIQEDHDLAVGGPAAAAGGVGGGSRRRLIDVSEIPPLAI